MSAELKGHGNPPTVIEKAMFWVIAGLISVFFAEIVSGSSPYAFFTLDGWLIVFPVYLLHIVLLSALVLKYGKPTLYTLYPAGMIFGMYETYITKVVWGSAEWGSSGPSIGGFYLIPFILVVLFWHAFMSFIVSLGVAEVSLTRSTMVLSHMPQKIRNLFVGGKRSWKIFLSSAVILGLMGMFNLDAVNSFMSSLFSSLFLLFIILLWRRYVLAHKDRTLLDYIPGKKGTTLALILIVLLYIITTIVFNPQYLPPVPVHVFTLLIYLSLFALLWRNLRISRESRAEILPAPGLSFTRVCLLIMVFVLTTTLEALFPLRLLIFAVFLVVEGIIGFLALYYSIRHPSKQKQN